MNDLIDKAQDVTDTNAGNNDLISRQDVEQTVEDNILCYTHSDRPIDQDPDTECHRAIRTALRMLRKDLRKLPSAQPEKRTKKRTETHACDCISRQAAIDAILSVTGNSSVRELYEHVQEHGLSDMWSGGVNAAIDIIIAVPSAEPEIIHCKDCKYHGYEHSEIGDIPYCSNVDYGYGWKDNDFCSQAERREDV